MPISFNEKAFIGAIGGISLAMLKLMEAGFYLDPNISTVESYIGYLTYLCFIFLGIVVAIFFTEHQVSIDKQRKNAFVLGLLAPSLLIAIVNQPIGAIGGGDGAPNGGHRDIDEINGLESILNGASRLFLGNAYAQQAPGAVADNGAGISVVPKKAVEPNVKSQVLCALGRCDEFRDHGYVIATTGDRERAVAAVAKISKVIAKYARQNPGQKLPEVKILKPESSQQYFIVIGGLQTKNSAAGFERLAREAGLAAAVESSDEQERAIGKLLVEGQLLRAAALFDGAHSLAR